MASAPENFPIVAQLATENLNISCAVSFWFFFSNFCWATAIFILGSPALATGTKILSVVLELHLYILAHPLVNYCTFLFLAVVVAQWLCILNYHILYLQQRKHGTSSHDIQTHYHFLSLWNQTPQNVLFPTNTNILVNNNV